MKSSQLGKDISVSIENANSLGIWLFTQGQEYFMSYDEYPFFKEQKLSMIYNVELIHKNHLYWPDIDVDLEIDTLEHPERYPLKSKMIVEQTGEKPATDYDVSKKV